MTQVARPTPERLDAFTLPSQPGNERLALARVAGTVQGRGLTDARLERLKTAVVEVEVTRSGDDITVAISDQGGETHPGDGDHEAPDLLKKLDGDQSPRGWGLFLIRNMVDAMDVTTDGQRRTIWLTMRTTGAAHDEHV
jgi:anti-sigma regulatory factor (Ser/Thr protein kinase)